MIYFAIAFIVAWVSVPLTLAILAFRKGIAYGLVWSVSRANRPVVFWVCVGAYMVGVVAGLFFLLILVVAANDPTFRPT